MLIKRAFPRLGVSPLSRVSDASLLEKLTTIEESVAPALTTYILDTFTAVDATNLNGRTPDITTAAAAWAVLAGSYSIVSNKALAGAVVSSASIDSSKADCVITCDVVMGDCTGTNNMQLLVRESDANNGWLINFTGLANTFSIEEWIVGVNTPKALIAFPIALNQVIALRVVLSGQTITATADGANQISYASAASNLNVTKHGFRAVQTGVVTTRGRWDNFKVAA